MNITEKIAAELATRDLNINRAASGTARDIRQRLKGLETELIDIIKSADIDEPARRAFRFKRLENAMEDIGKEIKTTYGAAAKDLNVALGDLSKREAAFTRSKINNEIGANILRAASSERLATMVDDALLEGAPAVEWWKSL